MSVPWQDRFNDQSGAPYDPAWPTKRPATTIATRPLVTNPGANANRFNGATKSRNDGIKVTTAELGVLQGFPAGYPWAGGPDKQAEQIGNAVPPPLAAAVVDSLLPKEISVKAVDLFAGPGGWSQGVRVARPSVQLVGVEYDEKACETARTAGHHRIHGDVSMLDPSLFAAAEYLHASPPCQGFSLAGKGKGRQDGERLLTAIHLIAAHPERVEEIMAVFDRGANDHRSVLTLEPLRWIIRMGRPRYVTLEQVPTVLPLWEAYAAALQQWGYGTWTGKLHAEQYGVPQTRTRAILMAELGTDDPQPPAPTHSRYYSRDRARLDEGVQPWVSMAEALGWGMTARPSVTVTAGSGRHGGPDPLDGGSGARQTLRRECDEGRWEDRLALRNNTSANAAVRDEGEPAPTIYFGERVNKVTWEPSETAVVSTGVNSATIGPGPERDALRAEGRWRECHKLQERPITAPAPTVDGKVGGAWKIHEPGERPAGQRRDSGPGAERRPRDIEEPSYTVRANGSGSAPSGVEWVMQQSNYSGPSKHPGQSAAERGLGERPVEEPSFAITSKGARWLATGTRPNAPMRPDHEPSPTLAFGNDAGSHVWSNREVAPTELPELKRDGKVRRITVQEAGVLQGFPHDYPWRGNKGQQHQQVGNAVPPPLAAAIVNALLPQEV